MSTAIKVSKEAKNALERLKNERFKGLSYSQIIIRLAKFYEENRGKVGAVKATVGMELDINCVNLVRAGSVAYCVRHGRFEVLPDLNICENCPFRVPRTEWDVDCPHLVVIEGKHYCALKAPKLEPIAHPEICRRCGRRMDIALKLLRLEKKLPADIVKQIRLPPDEVFVVIRTCDYDIQRDKEGRLMLFCPESYTALPIEQANKVCLASGCKYLQAFRMKVDDDIVKVLEERQDKIPKLVIEPRKRQLRRARRGEAVAGW